LEKKIFKEFRDLIYAKSGIALSDSKVALVSSRINKRMRLLGIGTHEAYLDFLKDRKSGDDEIVNFLDVISTNTTSFFREPAHFDYFLEFIEKCIKEGQKRFRIWCAASSSGEEPYTLAMLYLENFKNEGLDFKILATDISQTILNTALEGIYSEEKLKSVPTHFTRKYFSRIKEDNKIYYHIKEEVKDIVVYKWLNLSTPPFPMKGPLDLVFCRNVMIYFDNQIKQKLVENIYRLLRTDGALMVGHSESLSGLNTRFQVFKPAIYIKN
jgi:chemotaxis protein methyltransferase CheR